MRAETRRWHALAAAVILAAALPVAPALGQAPSSPTAVISIDAPSEGATVRIGQQVLIGGWAVDTAGSGTGVTAVQVFLDNRSDAGGRLLGNASYGSARSDVASSLGNVAYTNSGFNFFWIPLNVSTGSHTLYVYARSTGGAWTYSAVGVTVQGPSAQRFGYDNPYLPDPYPGSMYPNPWYPGSPMYPAYPTYPGYPPGGRICIMIYPPPPGC